MPGRDRPPDEPPADSHLNPRCSQCGHSLENAGLRHHFPLCPGCGGRIRLVADDLAPVEDGSANEGGGGDDGDGPRDDDGADVELSGDAAATLAATIDGLGAQIHQLCLLQAAEETTTAAPDAADESRDPTEPVDLSFPCPDCGDERAAVPAHAAADKLYAEDRLTSERLEALSANTHACLECETAFTP